MRILFIGATGLLGRPVAAELLRQGFQLTLLARNPEKMQSLFPEAPVAKGDVMDETSLSEAMTGMDACYVNLSILPGSRQSDPQPEREGLANILEAAKRSGLKRLVYLSSIVMRYQGMNGFQWWAFDIKQGAIRSIRQSGIPHTIFYPSTFMETYQNLVKGKRLLAISGSVQPMWMVATQDYARMIAADLQLPGTDNREWDVQGPEPFTWDEGNRVVAAHHPSGPLSIVKMPFGLVKLMGLFQQQMNYTGRIIEALNKYPETFTGQPAWDRLYKPTVKLQAFAAAMKP